MKTTFQKKTERVRKFYDLFHCIGSDKIQQVRSFTALGIAKLGWDKIDYVVKEVCYQGIMLKMFSILFWSKCKEIYMI